MADTKTQESQGRKTRTPRTLESITAGALALPLEDRISLTRALQDSIEKEVKDLNEAAQNAAKLASVMAGPQER